MHRVATAGFLDVEKHPDSHQMGITGSPSPLTSLKFLQSVVCLFVCNNRLRLVSCLDHRLTFKSCPSKLTACYEEILFITSSCAPSSPRFYAGLFILYRILSCHIRLFTLSLVLQVQ